MHIAVANVWLAVLVAVLQLSTQVHGAHGSTHSSHARRSLTKKVARERASLGARDGLFEPLLGE